MRSFLAIGLSFIAGSALTALGASASAQDERATADAAGRAEAAQVQANDAQARADELAKQGGPAYKSGAIESANRDAARLQEQADAARAEANGANWAPLAVSPKMAALQTRLASEKASGGWGYKSGAVRRTEADIRALKGPQPAATTETEEQPDNWGKPVEQVQPVNP
jgi:hypothetical protein